jgi:hypothetical protein
MTNICDVVRQVETALNDPCYPPTPEEKEILNTILYKVYTGSMKSGGNRQHDRVRSA